MYMYVVVYVYRCQSVSRAHRARQLGAAATIMAYAYITKVSCMVLPQRNSACVAGVHTVYTREASVCEA